MLFSPPSLSFYLKRLTIKEQEKYKKGTQLVTIQKVSAKISLQREKKKGLTSCHWLHPPPPLDFGLVIV